MVRLEAVRAERSETSLVEHACDRLLDAFLMLLASWTVVYHVCVVLRLGTTWAAGLEVVALGTVFAHVNRRPGTAEDRPPSPVPPAPAPALVRPLVVVTVAAALVAAVDTATSGPWVLAWVPWLVAATAGVSAAVLLIGPALVGSSTSTESPVARRGSELVVLAWAVAMAIASVFLIRPNPDDLFYLNYSQWVATQGSFPIRDTLFSELAYPMANWPPVASYDALVGTLARLTGAHAASVEYMVVPPIASALSVLALWRLLRGWRVRHVTLVLSVAVLFLLFDGTSAYATPGNLFVTRLWQGKVILLCVVVPLLLVHALRYVERPTRRRLGPLAVAGVAAVGLTTTAIFLVPLLAVASMAPLLRGDRRRALAGFAAMATYALAAGIVTKVVGGRSADNFAGRRLYRFDASWIGHQVFATGALALVAVLAVLLGALLLPHPAARITTGLLVFFTGLVLVPGATQASYAVAGLGPTLWRVSWTITVAALVGLAVVSAGTALGGRLRSPRRRPWVSYGTSALAVVLLAAFGSPVWSSVTTTEMRAPFHWQRSYSSRSVVTRILQVTHPGDLVLAPDSVSITLAVTTTEVRSVAPRGYYMDYLNGAPGFHYRARRALVHYVNDYGPAHKPGLAHDLRVVGVQVVCTPAADLERYSQVRSAGYTPFLTTTYYRCLQRN